MGEEYIFYVINDYFCSVVNSNRNVLNKNKTKTLSLNL